MRVRDYNYLVWAAKTGAVLFAVWLYWLRGNWGLIIGVVCAGALALFIWQLRRRMDFSTGGTGPMKIERLNRGKEKYVGWIQEMPTKYLHGHFFLIWLSLFFFVSSAWQRPDTTGVFETVVGLIITITCAVLVYNLLKIIPAFRNWAAKATHELGVAQASNHYENGIWMRRIWDTAGNKSEAIVELSKIASFELGDYNDWFVAGRNKTDVVSCWAIIAQPPDGAAVCIAQHAGTKAEMVELFRVLTEDFLKAENDISPDRSGSAIPSRL